MTLYERIHGHAPNAPKVTRCTRCGIVVAPDPDGWDAVCGTCQRSPFAARAEARQLPAKTIW